MGHMMGEVFSLKTVVWLPKNRMGKRYQEWVLSIYRPLSEPPPHSSTLDMKLPGEENILSRGLEYARAWQTLVLFFPWRGRIGCIQWFQQHLLQ